MPAPVEIVEGVWWLRGPRGANVYAIRLENGSAAIVDCGSPGSAEAIEDGLRAAGIAPADAGTLLLTHRHWDHAGSAAALRERLALTVVAGAADVEGGRLRGESAGWLARYRPAAEPATVDVALPMDAQREPLPGVVAVPSPGHTAGSVCYLLPDRELMFIGDVALHSGDRMSRPLPVFNEDTAAQERSLRAIAAQAPAHGTPGHGDPLTGHFGEWMRALASKPPASGPWFLRVLLNPGQMARFMLRSFRRG